jgi:hypothetical protein
VKRGVGFYDQATAERRLALPRDAEGHHLSALAVAAGGQMVHEAVIPDIAYHGALIDIPAAEIRNLIERRTVNLALADDIMFLRPQSMLLGPIEVEPGADATVGTAARPSAAGDPVAALLDGVPVQAHALLANRLRLDDPDNLLPGFSVEFCNRCLYHLQILASHIVRLMVA